MVSPCLPDTTLFASSSLRPEPRASAKAASPIKYKNNFKTIPIKQQ